MQAQLYFDNSPGSQSVNLVFHSHSLAIKTVDGKTLANTPFQELAITQNLIPPAPACIQNVSRRFTLMISDEDLFDKIRAKLKPYQKISVKQLHRIFYSVITVAVVGLIYWNLTDLVVKYCPWSWEKYIGQQVRAEIIESHPVIQDKRVNELLGKMVTPLAKAAKLEHPLRVEIIRNGSVNAVTLPGGTILIYSGLIKKAKDQSVLAGVLGHEMGHVKYHHTLRGMASDLGMNALFSVWFNSNISSQGQLILELKYSRGMETQADQAGIDTLNALNISTKPLGLFLKKLDHSSEWLQFASSHPSGMDREKMLFAADNGGKAQLLTDEEWKYLVTNLKSTKDNKREQRDSI